MVMPDGAGEVLKCDSLDWNSPLDGHLTTYLTNQHTYSAQITHRIGHGYVPYSLIKHPNIISPLFPIIPLQMLSKITHFTHWRDAFAPNSSSPWAESLKVPVEYPTHRCPLVPIRPTISPPFHHLLKRFTQFLPNLKSGENFCSYLSNSLA